MLDKGAERADRAFSNLLARSAQKDLYFYVCKQKLNSIRFSLTLTLIQHTPDILIQFSLLVIRQCTDNGSPWAKNESVPAFLSADMEALSLQHTGRHWAVAGLGGVEYVWVRRFNLTRIRQYYSYSNLTSFTRAWVTLINFNLESMKKIVVNQCLSGNP